MMNSQAEKASPRCWLATATSTMGSPARPTKLAMAPMSVRPLLIASTSLPRSKASLWTRIFIDSAPGHRREDRDLGMVRQRRIEGDNVLVDRHPERPPRRQLLSPDATAPLQVGDQIGRRDAGEIQGFLGQAEAFAQTGEIQHAQFHASNSEKGMKRTQSPGWMVWPISRSTSPSAQVHEVSTPELWLGKSASLPFG